MVKLSFGCKGWEAKVPEVFREAFAASEGEAEGAVIQSLVQDLMATTPEGDLFASIAFEDQTLLGCIFFSRLTFDGDERQAFMMSPVAVRSDRQKSGIGQNLIRFALDNLRQQGIDVVMTYGDPAYYGKTGFQPITEDVVRAPLPLSQPQGWLGQSLTSFELTPVIGPSRCVNAFNKPEIW